MIFDLWRHQPGKYFCISTKGKTGWRNHFFTRIEFEGIEEFLAKHKDEDIYFCPHGFTKRSRLAEHAAHSNLLWADLDAVDPRTLDPKPTIAWETSSRRYAAIWKLDAEPSRGLRKRFNDAIGADTGGWCLTKVLRVPGTLNLKPERRVNGRAPEVKLLWSKGQTYKLRDLRRQYGGSDIDHREASQPAININGLDWRKVLSKYGLKSQFASYVKYSVLVGKRSDVLWRLSQELREKGATPSETACVLWHSRAFQDKWGEDMNALRKEIARAFAVK
jgi:hypothetical protein